MADRRGQPASIMSPEYETRTELTVKDLTDDLQDRQSGCKGPQGEQVTQDVGRPNVASQVTRQTLSVTV